MQMSGKSDWCIVEPGLVGTDSPCGTADFLCRVVSAPGRDSARKFELFDAGLARHWSCLLMEQSDHCVTAAAATFRGAAGAHQQAHHEHPQSALSVHGRSARDDTAT